MTTPDEERSERSGDPTRAFVPGHVTGFFSVHPHDDPRRAGSRGAGIALADGVAVGLTPTDDPDGTTITLRRRQSGSKSGGIVRRSVHPFAFDGRVDHQEVTVTSRSGLSRGIETCPPVWCEM